MDVSVFAVIFNDFCYSIMSVTVLYTGGRFFSGHTVYREWWKKVNIRNIYLQHTLLPVYIITSLALGLMFARDVTCKFSTNIRFARKSWKQ